MRALVNTLPRDVVPYCANRAAGCVGSIAGSSAYCPRCLAGQLPDACRARGDIARQLAARLEIPGHVSPDIPGARGRLAYALEWDSFAAVEYPRPILSDGVDCDRVAPEHAPRVWHHIAGAMILPGPPWACECGAPAVHRDALVAIAREIRGGAS